MLAKTARLTESGDFARATKTGLRCSTANFVGYLYINATSTEPARAGLIISKSVGGSVVRHRLARKIRHCLHDQYAQLPAGSLLVIKGLNKSATANCQIEISEVVSLLVKKTHERASKK
ncbi:MAG: ribonuclease P protein component [Candidatus Planktophila sp.]|nr:ribonuclease P protein component [Candidatus Planktophila sp.]